MKAIAVLFVLTLASMLALKFFIAPRYGEDVEARFIERSKTIWSQGFAPLSRDHLEKWLSDAANASAIRGYVMPVLFPFDIFFLCFLGLFLGTSSVALCERVNFLAAWPTWLPWLFPTLYMAFDLAEDAVIALIFMSGIALTEFSYALLRALTAVKIATVSLAIVQVGVLGITVMLRRFFG